MAEKSVVQTIKEAEIDARSLSEFISKGASFTVTRRLAPTIHTLDYYLLVLNRVKEKGDLADIAISDTLDKLEQLEPTVIQRVEDAITNTVLSSGFVIVDSFEVGATITQRNQALRHAADGKLYRWAGDLPKTVTNGSTPESSGGMGGNAWLEVSDVTLRQDLINIDGRIKGMPLTFPYSIGASLAPSDIIPAGTKAVRINGVLFWLVENLSGDFEVDYIDETAMRVYFKEGGNTRYSFLYGMHKQFALTSDGGYFVLSNLETNKPIIRWADGSNPSESHVYSLPVEVRRNSHSLICSAATRDGTTDILFRTSGYSDYFYVNGRTEHQNEAFVLSHDIMPARADGTKKDGTGGGGQLPPEQDRYAFDDSLVIPSNTVGSRTDKTKQIRFPSLYALFEQGMGVMRRTYGQNMYHWWHGGSNITSQIDCTTSGKELILLTPKSTVVGGTVFPSKDRDRLETPLVSASQEEYAVQKTRFSYSDYVPSISAASPYAINLIGPGVIKLVRIAINLFTDAGEPYYWIGNFQFTGSEVVAIGEPVTNVLSNVVISAVVNEAGGMEFRITPAGPTFRVSIAYDIN